MSLDLARTIRIEVEKTLELSNDYAVVVVEEDYEPFALFQKATVSVHDIDLFTGFVYEIRHKKTTTEYRLVAPSVFLSRTECPLVFEEQTPISAIVSQLAPGFKAQGDILSELHTDPDSYGKTAWDIFEEIAEKWGKVVYVKDDTIYFSENYPETTGKTIELKEEEIEIDQETKEGGDDFYSKVVAIATIKENDSYELAREEVIVKEISPHLIDVIRPEDLNFEIISRDDLKKAARYRAEEIKRNMNQFRFRTFFRDISPLDVVVVGSKQYKVAEVRHILTATEHTTEVTAWTS